MLRLEAQADAQVAPLIDYRVLEAFKKGASLATYDYGQYVDAMGNGIPSWCIRESDGNGAAYKVGESYYAWWDLTLEGCAGRVVSKDDTSVDLTEEEEAALPKLFYNEDSETEVNEQFLTPEEMVEMGVRFETSADGQVLPRIRDLNLLGIERRTEEDGSISYVKTTVLRAKIWRTPQFTVWHNAGFMDLNGVITGVQHFNSECTTYSGVTLSNSEMAKWTSNNTCMLVPDGLRVTSSSNGRDDSDNLVLKFDAQLTIDSEFFAFRNKHMMAIGPVGQNVTDSYVQIGGMFTQPATECAEGDRECMSNTSNSSGDDDEDEDSTSGSSNTNNTNNRGGSN